MRKTIELKKIINSLKTEVNDLQTQGKMDEATKKAEELKRQEEENNDEQQRPRWRRGR